jgi:phosphomannomutase
LKATVENKADVLLITDGDADRCGIGDENGQFINQMQVYAILAYYLLEIRGWRGPLIKTTTTTQMVDALANIYNVPVHTVKIGFKYAAPKMLEIDALMAGEESGSYAFRGLPERDGILAGLFILDFMKITGLKASGLLKKIESVIGKYYFKRQDVTISEAQKKALRRLLVSEEITKKFPLSGIDQTDGVKYILTNGDWLFFRFSGTEPVIRIAAESKDAKKLNELINSGMKLVSSIN